MIQSHSCHCVVSARRLCSLIRFKNKEFFLIITGQSPKGDWPVKRILTILILEVNENPRF